MQYDTDIPGIYLQTNTYCVKVDAVSKIVDEKNRFLINFIKLRTSLLNINFHYKVENIPALKRRHM
jgi:hypothetical protein